MNSFVQDYLQFLDVQEVDDRVVLLKEIVAQHQLRFPFDSVLKILNHHNSLPMLDQIAPEPTAYLKFVTQHGYGGTCFHLVHGLYQLLQALEYDVQRVYMDHGHYALVVQVERQRWLIEVSYMSPLFDIYSLDVAWRVDTHRDVISWEPSADRGGTLVFEGFGHLPGQLTRSWDGSFSSLQQFREVWSQSFHQQSPFLRTPMLARWESISTLLFCQGRQFRTYTFGRLVEEIDCRDNPIELRRILNKRFGVNSALYEEALRITDAPVVVKES